MSAVDVLTLADLIVLDVHQIGLRAQRSARDAMGCCSNARCPSTVFGWDRKRTPISRVSPRLFSVRVPKLMLFVGTGGFSGHLDSLSTWSGIRSRKIIFRRALRFPTRAVASNSAPSSLYVPVNPMVTTFRANSSVTRAGSCSRTVNSPFHLPLEQV